MYIAQVPLDDAVVVGNLCEYRIVAIGLSDISLKLDSLDYIFVADCIGLRPLLT